jgi:hypothetical protein
MLIFAYVSREREGEWYVKQIERKQQRVLNDL